MAIANTKIIKHTEFVTIAEISPHMGAMADLMRELLDLYGINKQIMYVFQTDTKKNGWLTLVFIYK